jgi:hypothetical protein
VLTALLLTAGVSAPAASARQGDGDEQAHRARDVVAVPLGAVDKGGRPVEGLKEDRA